MAHRVRFDYVVHEDGRAFHPGEVFEPSPETLENQGYKLDPVTPEPAAKTQKIQGPPQDRMIKKPPRAKKR